MSNREQLNLYLARIEKRLRMSAWSVGVALTAATLVIATLLMVLLANHYAFSSPSVAAARVLLFILLAAAVAWALVRPLWRLNRRNAAKRAEGECPDFQQRLLTFVEKSSAANADPFLELLAADTLAVSERAAPSRIVPQSRIVAAIGATLVALLAFLWLLTGATGFLGYGAAKLWGATSRTGTKPFYEIQVLPGNAIVRKGGDQTVTANLLGFQSTHVRLMARFASRPNWDEAAMSPATSPAVSPRQGSSGIGFQFLFAGIDEPVEYYVEADGYASKHFKLDVLDLPGIKNMRVTYHYPAWTGMKDEVRDHAGDLSAVEGTSAEVQIEFDRPLREGALALDGHTLPLQKGAGTFASARVPIERDGAFHAEAIEGGKNIRISEDFFIAAHKVEPPAIAVKRPGRDAKVSPLQEVTVEVEARDEFALQGMELHYSVNGGAEKIVSMLDAKIKEANGTTIIALEESHLVPGDVVSLYATARDAKNSAKTDIYFLEAQPYDREYSQKQGSGGGGGGGGGDADQQGQISQRQKEVIAATWNQVRDTTKDKNAAASNAKFLSEMQSKLRDQAHSLAERMRSRELNGENTEFESFVKDMDTAAEAMKGASDRLKGQGWQEAMPGEQKALQFLLRAEATFRQIQVSMQQQGGGGNGGGSMGSGRDLESLLDLELDTDKNQYETQKKAQNNSGGGEQRQKEIDEALQKLEQLARRQQELADQQSKQKQQSFQQRWQQELLRREAEELQKRMEQLARGEQQQSQAQGAQVPQSGQQQSGQQQSGQQQSAEERLNQMSGQSQQQRQATPQSARSDQKIREALQRLEQATKDMKRAGENNQNGQNAADSKRALEQLQQARDLVAGMRKQESAGQLRDLTDRASSLADKQKDYADRVQKQFGEHASPAPGVISGEANGKLSIERQRMIEELRKLESDMQNAAKDLAGTQRGAANKVREALNNLERSDVEARMQTGADLIGRGLGQLQAPREQPVTAGLERLREDLKGAQQAVTQQQAGDSGSLERQLAQVGQLRNQLRTGGLDGFDRVGAIHTLNDIWRGESFGGDLPATRAIEEVIRDVATRPTQTAAALEKLELLLRRKLQEQAGQVRAGSADRVPEGYSDAVADYFRRLTKK